MGRIRGLADYQTLYYAARVLATGITIAGAAWQILERKRKKQASARITLVAGEKPPPVEVPDWIQKQFPRLADSISGYPDYYIQDKKLFDDYLRMNETAIAMDAYVSKMAPSPKKKNSSVEKTFGPEYLSAINFAKTQLLRGI